MESINEIKSRIHEELGQPEPSYYRIETYFKQLRRIHSDTQDFSDQEFFDLVGEAFILKPESFIKYNLPTRIFPYHKDRELRNRMARYIIEKHSLYEGEKILHEYDADIKMIDKEIKLLRNPLFITLKEGHIYVTNNRIIAHGNLEVKGGQVGGAGGFNILELILDGIVYASTGGAKRDALKNGMLGTSTTQELPCYGYEFPIKHVKLAPSRGRYKENPKKMIAYFVKSSEKTYAVTIKRRNKTDFLDGLYQLISNEEVVQTEVVKTNINDRRMFTWGLCIMLVMVPLYLFQSTLIQDESEDWFIAFQVGFIIFIAVVGFLMMLGPAIRYFKGKKMINQKN